MWLFITTTNNISTVYGQNIVRTTSYGVKPSPKAWVSHMKTQNRPLTFLPSDCFKCQSSMQNAFPFQTMYIQKHPHLYVQAHIHNNSDTNQVFSRSSCYWLQIWKGCGFSKITSERLQDLRPIWAPGTVSSLHRWKVSTATITYRTDEV